jgi:hypothetical protein
MIPAMEIVTAVVASLVVAAILGGVKLWWPRVRGAVCHVRAWPERGQRRRATDALLVYVLELGRPIRDEREQSEINHRFGLQYNAAAILFAGGLLERDALTDERRLTDRGRARAEQARS